MKPMNDLEIENAILEMISPINEMHSNQVFRELHVNKSRYNRIRDKMIKENWIRVVERNGRKYLTRSNFESPKFENTYWTKIAKINCNSYLKHLKDNNKPLFKVDKNKKLKIGKNQKRDLDGFFHELDRQMIVYIRLVNAQALGLITPDKARQYQKICVEFVQERIKALLEDHKKFKEEIKEYAQSQLRMVQFKI